MDGHDSLAEASGAIDPVRLLNRRYRAAFVAVAFLVLLNSLVIQPSLLRLTSDAQVINIAGRQRMLSQRLAKTALALERARDPADRARLRGELEQVLGLWSSTHDALRRGASPSSLPIHNNNDDDITDNTKRDTHRNNNDNNNTIRSAFDGLEPYFRPMNEAGVRLLRGRDDLAGDDLSTILDNEPEYLSRMDRIVGLFEREARAKIDRLVWTGWGVTGLILVVMAGIGGFILEPAARLIRRQFGELRHARDVLEARVLERTHELERESRERAMAEERHRAVLEQFGHVARTSTIGEMATGLAHELNQPLGAIANYTEGCLVALESTGPETIPVREALRKILATTLRAGQIVSRIRRFVTRHDPIRESVDPNRLVTDVEDFVRDESRRQGVTLQTQLASDLPWVWADPVQIQQVLVNLVRNATDASLATKVQVPTVVMWTRLAPSGVPEFGVTDNGEGIPDDRFARIFDAYFSTRDQGMGMGLAISRTIVDAHGGRIDVESEPGVRTTFRFTLRPAGVDDAGTDGLRRRR